MKNYIVLDGYQYMTLSNDWAAVPVKPGISRYLLSGDVDVSYGPGAYKEYRGTVILPNSAEGLWGTRSTFEASFSKREGLNFTDHEENARVVHLFGEAPYKSLSPVWDGPSNEFHVQVRLVCE